MGTSYVDHVQTRVTPQSEPVPGKPMVENSAGGYTFEVDDWKRLERFLVLGAEGGTYYTSEKQLTRENAQCVERCLKIDAARTVNTIVRISHEGRAPKNDPAVFALALCASLDLGDAQKAQEAHRMAYDAISRVCRTGTHLFQFVSAVDALRGWGSGLRSAIARWYNDKEVDQIGYQVTKYQQRNGWSHRDVLRLASPRPNSEMKDTLFRWVVSGMEGLSERQVTRGKGDKAVTKTYPAKNPDLLPPSVRALESLKKAPDAATCANLLRLFGDKATREMVPTQFLSSPEVWEALLETMPMTAMMRNLGTMTRVGLVKPLSNASRVVCERLRDGDRVKKARLHPLSVLVALKTYSQGHGVKSQGEGWVPDHSIVAALNDAFYLGFDAVEPTNKRWLFGLDVSGSMGWSSIAGLPLRPSEAAAALAMVSLRTEPYTCVAGFAEGFRDLGLNSRMSLEDVVKKTSGLTFGSTDCAVPMIYALQNRIEVDTFAVVTDGETYYGGIHPFQALKEYRQKMGIGAKMIVIATSATSFTIADPSDAGMLDVCGMSTDVPAVIADFARN